MAISCRRDQHSSSHTEASRTTFTNCRGGGNRTRNPRFWRPVLCQLSYTPKANAECEIQITKQRYDSYFAIRFSFDIRHSTFVTFYFSNLRHNAGADRAATFTDGKTHVVFHGDRRNQLDRELDVIAGHAHVCVSQQRRRARHVRRAKVELGTIAAEERRVPPAFFLREDIDLASNCVWGVIDPGLAKTWPRSISLRSTPRSRQPTLSPACPGQVSY